MNVTCYKPVLTTRGFSRPPSEHGVLDTVTLGHPPAESLPPGGLKLDTTNDWRHDGQFVVRGGQTVPAGAALSSLPFFRPDDGTPVRGTLVMLNGMMTDLAMQAQDLQDLANQGYQVIGIHNATKGMVMDTAQILGDKLAMTDSSNKAIDTAAELLQQFVGSGLPLHLVGHSQGALILSRAVGLVKEKLKSEGLSEEEAAARLSKLSISTLGGSAATYPEGPHYTHYHNRFDLFSNLAGRALVAKVSGGMANEKFRSFNELNAPHDLPSWSEGASNKLARLADRMFHGARDVYIPRFSLEA